MPQPETGPKQRDRKTPETDRVLWCASGVHLVVIDGDLVVLDLLADQYQCLLDAAGLCFPQPDGSVAVTDNVTAHVLEEAGIASRQAAERPRQAITPALRELALDPNPPKIEILHALGVWAIASIIFRKKSLANLVDRHSTLRSRTTETDEVRLGQIAGAARLARPWIPFEGECLKRSFQLRCLLATRGIACDWVFGVRTWPFAAHCWLQIGDLVVGDRLERIRLYTPIMSG